MSYLRWVGAIYSRYIHWLTHLMCTTDCLIGSSEGAYGRFTGGGWVRHIVPNGCGRNVLFASPLHDTLKTKKQETSLAAYCTQFNVVDWHFRARGCD